MMSVFEPIGAGDIACALGASINANAPAAASIDNFFIVILQLKFCIVAPDAFAPLRFIRRRKPPGDAVQRDHETVVPWRIRGGGKTKFYRRAGAVQLRFRFAARRARFAAPQQLSRG
jgi:hypothetical protein